jgi:uncharacterized protein
MRISKRGVKRRLIAAAVILPLGIGANAMFDLRGLAEAKLFYYPSRDPFVRAPMAEEVWFQTPEGLRLHGWFFPARGASAEAPAPSVVHAHGNAGSIAWHTEFSAFLVGEGFSVLIFDYRGYGKSDLPRRRLCREDLVTDTKSALDYLAQRADVDARRIGMFGVSLGAAIGTAAAAEDERARAVISVSGFSSWRGIARDHGGSIACRIIRPGLDASEAVTRLGDRPLLVVHGARDTIVPSHHANTLADAAAGAGVAVEVMLDPEGDHNSIIFSNPELQRRIAAWLREALGGDRF